MNSMDWARATFRGVFTGTALLLATVFLAAAPVAATPAYMDSTFGFLEDGLEGLPSGTIDGEDSFLSAGEGAGAGAPGLDVELSGSTNLCIFTASSPTCQGDTTGITGAYSALMTITVSAINTLEIDGPFTLLLTGLAPGSYAASEVTVELNPTVPAGLDTSGIEGFGFEAFGHSVDETYAPGTLYHYIGWRVEQGDTVSFRYDVSTAPGIRGAPQLTANAVPRSVGVVPEPGTALLMGLGLAGLAIGKRRVARQSD